MPVSALALVFAAACLHALWNVLLARSADVEAATAVALVTAVVVALPIVVVIWTAERAVWPFVVASGLLELGYFALLATAYRFAPLSLVYPIARGGAPVLVLVGGAVLLGRGASWRQVVGVGLVVLGIVLVRGLGHPNARGVAFGLTIAALIASYTLVDKSGVRHAGALSYLELTMAGPAVIYCAAVVRLKGVPAVRGAVGWSSVIAGIFSFGAYALVLAALKRAPAAPVAAVRETSVVIAALLAAVVLKEKVTAPRLAGTVLVAGGVALLAS